jgi:CubicO group peptidase (beta-lactamase class C family)
MSADVLPALRDLLAADLEAWGTPDGSCAVVTSDSVVSAGDIAARLPWASVTKVVAALAVLDVAHDGLLDLDEPAGPPGSTVRHLLAHASGLAFDDNRSLVAPGRRRIYSNVGIDLAAAAAARRGGYASPAALLDDRVLTPLAMTGTTIDGPAAYGARGPVADLIRLAAELLDPRVLRADVVTDAITPAYPSLAGVLPGFGRQDPNDWGLGVEVRGRKSPHWMPASVSPSAFGHFGQSGSFLMVDRSLGMSAVALTGRAFGPWAAEAWPISTEAWIQAWSVGRDRA